ncbi:MAG: hypothetical protein EP330_02750 [Deltaproteobacteria bacterium]|nr:MAG: hypothetical protein EP330_02750 [Deltaproteobacteria bacterium]
MALLLLWLVIWVCPARAQDCRDLIGGGGAVTVGHRDWDLSTPSGFATTGSPALGMLCTTASTWIGVEAAPGLRHSYGPLVSRGSLGFTAHLGLRLGWAPEFGPHVVTNGVAWGMGMRIAPRFLPFELRFDAYPSRDPTFALTVFVHARETDATEDGFDVGWGQNPLRLRHGFEMGTFVGYRVELGERRGGPKLGLRVGTLGRPRRGVVVQPLAVSFVDVPVGNDGLTVVELSMGASMRHGVVDPAGGVRLLFASEGRPVNLYAGWTVGLGADPWRVGDLGIGMVW